MPTILQKRVRLAAKRCAGASDLVFWFVLVALWVLVAWVGSWLWLGALFCLVLFLGWFPLFCGCSFGVFFFPGLDENQEGKDGSYMYYYMKEHQDSTAEDARKHAVSKISDAWKGLNKECLSPNPFSTSFTRASLNLARMVPLMYGYDDNQRLPILEQYIKSLLHESTDLPGVY
ncbi:hypothetical protein LWI29_032564 [Acer saccharum]|uniref:Terpene synthase metal-binding domain-containing protein n=1 Tax=Acer saccharum TaxID=4024 RepID=A0AA39W4T0_ACESA|nr:hypothetical protein LWI29_032564 [Acer saccharum]